MASVTGLQVVLCGPGQVQWVHTSAVPGQGSSSADTTTTWRTTGASPGRWDTGMASCEAQYLNSYLDIITFNLNLLPLIFFDLLLLMPVTDVTQCHNYSVTPKRWIVAWKHEFLFLKPVIEQRTINYRLRKMRCDIQQNMQADILSGWMKTLLMSHFPSIKHQNVEIHILIK